MRKDLKGLKGFIIGMEKSIEEDIIKEIAKDKDFVAHIMSQDLSSAKCMACESRETCIKVRELIGNEEESGIDSLMDKLHNIADEMLADDSNNLDSILGTLKGILKEVGASDEILDLAQKAADVSHKMDTALAKLNEAVMMNTIEHLRAKGNSSPINTDFTIINSLLSKVEALTKEFEELNAGKAEPQDHVIEESLKRIKSYIPKMKETFKDMPEFYESSLNDLTATIVQLVEKEMNMIGGAKTKYRIDKIIEVLK